VSAQSADPDQKPATYGRYAPGVGFTVAETEYETLNIRTYTYLRYLNQRGLDPTYTNAFGKTTDVQQRRTCSSTSCRFISSAGS
jgi:hypothetical protein